MAGAGAGVKMLPHTTHHSEFWEMNHAPILQRLLHLWRRTNKKFHRKIVQNSNPRPNTMDAAMFGRAAHFWVTIFHFVVYRLSMAGSCLHCRIHSYSLAGVNSMRHNIIESYFQCTRLPAHFGSQKHTRTPNEIEPTATTKDAISSLAPSFSLHNTMAYAV